MKDKRPKVRYSKTPPPGWPTEDEWKKIERRMAKNVPSKVWPPDSSPVDLAKCDICEQFVKFLMDQKISQRRLAKILGVTESRVSEIVRYRHERFTIDKLMELLGRIKPELRIKII